MTVAAPCQSHRWFVPSGDDGVALASCFNCHAQQYQPTDGSRESAQRANELNKTNGYPLLTVSSKRDYSTIKHAGDLKPPEEVRMVTHEGLPQAENNIDKRKGQDHRLNFTKNRGARERYDAIAQQVIDDAVRLGSWGASCRLHNIPSGSITALVRHWRKQGLSIPLVAHIKKSRRTAKATEKSAEKTVKDIKIIIPGLSGSVDVKPSLPLWNEAWGDNVKIEWLKTMAIIGREKTA